MLVIDSEAVVIWDWKSAQILFDVCQLFAPTWVEAINNPVLCDAGRVTVNAHAFFDRNVKAAGADDFIEDVVLPNIRRVCAPYSAVKNIIITESGWPSRGANFGAAVPSLANGQAALKSPNCVAGSTKIIAFEADSSDDNEKSKSLARLQIKTLG